MSNFLNKLNVGLNKQISKFTANKSISITDSVQNIYFKKKHTMFYAEDNYKKIYLRPPEFADQQYNDLIMYEKLLSESEKFDN
ncbi:MAG: hypothetical protein WCX32_01570 [Clostridia bacterium]|jgi:hypothetical protein|nr:hypothetical protein [Clostridia bacterium]MDD4275652.1 hypothetical protein [Clostridia bacterium]